MRVFDAAAICALILLRMPPTPGMPLPPRERRRFSRLFADFLSFHALTAFMFHAAFSFSLRASPVPDFIRATRSAARCAARGDAPDTLARRRSE